SIKIITPFPPDALPIFRGRRADLELFAAHVREPARDLEGPIALLGDYGANPDRPLLSKERRPASVDPGEILVELGRAVMRRHFPDRKSTRLNSSHVKIS